MATYLLRLNLDIKEKNFKDQLRFKLAASSVKFLSRKNNKIVILSHLDRPHGIDKSLSLQHFARALSSTTGQPVKFVPHFDFQKIKAEISNSPGGSVFLLENLRFLPAEAKNSKKLAKELASLGNQYINDDFATSHRAAASIAAITKFLPSRPGPILKKEIESLKKIKDHPRHPFVLIIGGAKMSDKMGVMKNLLPLADYVLLGGGPANNFLKARGVNIGSSIYNQKLMKTTRTLIRNKKIIIPIDWQKRRGKILDIGQETIKLYIKMILQAKTIIWNGPMGYFEDQEFAAGTAKIAKAIIGNKKARRVIGGGETMAALPIKIANQGSGKLFLSSGGGAMLAFLANEKMPALDALDS